MGTLPQLLEEDIRLLEFLLQEFLQKTDATTALVVDQGGFLIAQQGDTRHFDLTTIAALASGAYLATQTMASLVQETNFNSVYHQGEKYSMFILRIDDQCMLVVLFKAQISVGAVKYFAMPTARQISAQLKLAHERAPEVGLDLSMLNMADTSSVFKRRS